MSKWDELSMAERAAMMKVAVRNGITNLSDIREKYNEFAGGGNTKSDDDLIDRIIQEEGFSKKPEDIGDGKRTLGSGLTAKKWHDLYAKRGNKWSAADNRRAVAEEVANRRRWAERNIPNWEKLPDSSQKALLSYKYNYDFTRSNSPKLFKALEAGNLQEAARQIDATSKDPKFKKGLQARRQREQNWFLPDLNLNQRPTTAMPVETPVSTAMYNPFAIQQQTTQAYPIRVPDEDSYVTAHPLTTGELKAQEMKERFDAVNRFNALMNMIGFENNPLPSFTSTSNVFLDSLSPLINGNANGGKIYIKPSHRGRLTELKARTGKTEAELYNDGNPAHKRMVVFARNSRKWKHGLGGPLDANENVFLTGGPKRHPAAAKPAKKNRFEDMSIEELEAIEKANEEYWRKQQEGLDNRTPEQIRQMGIEADKNYRQRNPNGGKADPNLQRSAGVVMSALSDIANSTPFTGSEVAEAAEVQRQEKLDKVHELKMGLDATMTAAEFLAAGYGVTRGLTHLNRYMARQATQSTGQAISRDAMRNLAKWNRRVAQIDKPQVLMNGIGGTADAYQWATANNSFDAWENGLETGANAAGVVGGMNWFRDLPYLRRIGGEKIDAILDGLGYGAATWDIVKNIPPLSTALESAREERGEVEREKK